MNSFFSRRYPAMDLGRPQATRFRSELPFPLDSRNVDFFYSARYALLAVAHFLHRPVVSLIVPSYCCGTELDPFLHLGMKLEFYSVGTDLGVDLEELLSLIRPNTVGVLLTHFFGFPAAAESVRRLCDREGIALIEDCAHAFLSANHNGPLGRMGDFSVFSLRKSLPLPFGAILHGRDGNPASLRPHRTHCRLGRFLLRAERTRETYSEVPYRAKKLERLRTKLTYPAARGASLCARLIGRFSGGVKGALMDPDSYCFWPDLYGVTMSASDVMALRGFDFDAIFNRRRSNYLYLLDRFKDLHDFEPLFPSLPDGICPLLFPVLAENRDAWSEQLNRAGLGHFRWWSWFHPGVSWSRFPAAVRLKNGVLGIPIHQDIDERFLDAVVNILAGERKRYARRVIRCETVQRTTCVKC